MSTAITPQQPTETKYFDFMSRFKKEAEYFKHELTRNGKPWPRVKPVKERVYENWIAEVVDPVTGEYYKDADGNSASYKIDKIVRMRRIDGTEVLYSGGQLVGFDSFKDIKTYPAEKPEVHIKTIFEHKKDIDRKRNQILRITSGPKRIEEVYDLAFTPENCDILWNQKRDRNVQLILKDELSSESHALERKGIIAANDLAKAFELFKTAPFDYLYNWEYTKPQASQLEQLQKDKEDSLQEELKRAQPDTKTRLNKSDSPEKVK